MYLSRVFRSKTLGRHVPLMVMTMHKGISTTRSMTRFVILLCLLVAGRGALVQSTGKVTYVYTDPQGTPLAEVDASGNITAEFDYTPYGTNDKDCSAVRPWAAGHFIPAIRAASISPMEAVRRG